ncbi:DUF6660 family protein [Mucilaginibacter pineti]|uniref:DUF6660 family protein n=1 Tax=Mucilaginibacter pineti TaxID=1391627 RepID=UPI000B82A00B|nr:DUF6660 family protein [Mucilaginibacter pineti]
MKYLAFLFSLYFTLLAILPCQDREDNMASVVHATIQTTHSGNDHAGQEVCPPFCTCTCCSTARNLVSKPVSGLFFKVVDRQYPDSKIPAVQEQSMAIWQPPQSA